MKNSKPYPDSIPGFHEEQVFYNVETDELFIEDGMYLFITYVANVVHKQYGFKSRIIHLGALNG